jgi:hypothetical protein
MSRFTIGACAVSALALAYAAHADTPTQNSTEIIGYVPSFCTILGTPPSSKPLFTSGDDVDTTYDTTKGVKVHFKHFANSDGTAPELAGNVKLHVYTNAQCSYELRSANGALQNQNHTAAFRKYEASAYQDGHALPRAHLWSLTGDTFVNSFDIDAPATTQTSVVLVDFDIPESTVPLAAGHYQDVLTLKITPN